MRFYFGFSKRIPLKFIIGVLGTIFLGFLVIYCFLDVAYADTIGIPSSIVYEAGGNQVSANVLDSGQGYYSFSISNLGMNSKNFIYSFNANSSLCPSQKAKFTFNFNFNDENNQPDEHLYIESLKYYDNQIISGSLTGSGYKTLTINNLDLTKSFSFIINETYGDKLIWSAFSPASYECISSESEIIIDNATQNTQDIIDNQNQNTQDIIDNATQNTQDIIDSNKENFQTCRDSLNLFNGEFRQGNQLFTDVPKRIFSKKNDLLISNGETISFSTNLDLNTFDYSIYIAENPFLTSNNTILYNSGYKQSSSFTFTSSFNGYLGFTIRYKNENDITPSSVSNFHFMLAKGNITTYEPYGEQICSNKLDDVNSSINGLNDSLNDDNVSGATSNASSGFSNADVSEPIGLTSIITSPIRLLQKLLDGGTCDAYSFDITMNNQSKNVSLPSGCILWDNVPGTIIALYHVTIFGLLGYRILIDMVHFVNNLRDPDKKNDYTLDL